MMTVITASLINDTWEAVGTSTDRRLCNHGWLVLKKVDGECANVKKIIHVSDFFTYYSLNHVSIYAKRSARKIKSKQII